ncbi:hypothetical protein PENSPDRAFT_654711 [Peniophora sp. CONT]|nr:hypothetical protein PENSPDRAFT_654711 [Peniophora sp. CONT]
MNVYIWAGIHQCGIHSTRLGYDGGLANANVRADFEFRAQMITKLILHTEEDVSSFLACANTTNFPKLICLDICCDLRTPAETLQGIFETMQAMEKMVWRRVKLTWSPTTMVLDMSVLPPSVRSLLQNPPTPDPKFMEANIGPFALQLYHMWRRDPLWTSIIQRHRQRSL